MMRLAALIVLMLVGLAVPGPARAQAALPADTTPAAETWAMETVPAEGAPAAERVAPPRTLRGYWHLFIAFALAWLLLFGYLLYLGARTRRIERELQALRDPVDAA